MNRRLKGVSVHGWIVLDKARGMTSTQAVSAVRRLFNARKAGHAGTLDPLATGILPIALGEATKTVSFVMDGVKAYRFTARWGAETDTDDAEGAVTATSDRLPEEPAIRALIPRFTGLISQVPPRYSAVKIDGQRAYDLAREGEPVELEARLVSIDDLRLVELPDRATAVFEAQCGKGTYVRALVRDIGRLLGCYGHVVALRRTRVGPFNEEQAITIHALKELASEDDGLGALSRALLPLETALAELDALNVTAADASRLANGQPVLLRGRDAPIRSGPAFAVCHGRPVAICEIEAGELRPLRVFNWA
ncbi:MAG TPA: tRNA pseudouridine(55) synthase TruB [Hyphomicrobiaceae bacterium]|nr:tRNA pseudouridine(55) synthase TruB [Hyphomicrobiaceae bacterium]